MEKELNESLNEFHVEQYESPRMVVIEMEIEGPILQMSGEDSICKDW